MNPHERTTPTLTYAVETDARYHHLLQRAPSVAVSAESYIPQHPRQYHQGQLPETPALANLFISTPFDAQVILEAALDGKFPILNAGSTINGITIIQSGTIVIFAENNANSQMVRWRDGKRWSPSRPQGPYLLYREVESSTKTTFVGSTTEQSTRFTNMALRANCRFIPNGLAKRTIGLTGSDGLKYRVISYFYPIDVEHFYNYNMQGRLIAVSQCVEFRNYIQQAKAVFTNQQPVVETQAERPQSTNSPSPRSGGIGYVQDSHPDPVPAALLVPSYQRRFQSFDHKTTPYTRSPPKPKLESSFTVTSWVQRKTPCEDYMQPWHFHNSHGMCPCGGLGAPKSSEHFKHPEDWMGVKLAPLFGLPQDRGTYSV
ncbi:UNVERIFIED_CONTAM: hypothetical protein HDU68_007648 [Siphonaria sp. JEL0065]|nr:hypothetical protein HDU68_007648 [Siphonaria sp. JEL0065]